MRQALLARRSASLVVSNVLAADRIGTHPGRAWVDTLRTEAGRSRPWRGPGAVGPVGRLRPETVLQAVWWNESALLSSMLVPVPRRGLVRRAGRTPGVPGAGRRSASVPIQISRAEHVRPRAPTPPAATTSSRAAAVDVPMSSALFHWGWGLEVTAFSATGGDLVVDLGSTDVELKLPSGSADARGPGRRRGRDERRPVTVPATLAGRVLHQRRPCRRARTARRDGERARRLPRRSDRRIGCPRDGEQESDGRRTARPAPDRIPWSWWDWCWSPSRSPSARGRAPAAGSSATTST